MKQPSATRAASRREGFTLLFFTAVSALIVLFASKSSPLYPMNDWVDVNCFFTVGRGILHGLMPYRDLYEQKGPLLYAVFSMAAGISETSFTGVYLAETVMYSLFLYFSWKTSCLLCPRPALCAGLTALLGACVAVSPAFCHGSAAEELFIWPQSAALFLVLRTMLLHRPAFRWEAFAVGALAGVALLVKYTLCGFYCGMALAVLVWSACSGNLKTLPRTIGFVCLGITAVCVATTAWFAAAGALQDLLRVYFGDNLALYAASRAVRHDSPVVSILRNWIWTAPAALGLAGMLCAPSRFRWQLATTVLCAALLSVSTWIGGKTYPYYTLALCVFMPMSASVFSFIPGKQKKRRLSFVLPPVCAAVAAAICLLFSPNAYLRGVPLDAMPAGKFASVIRKSENRSLLNYGFLDGGFYFASQAEPFKPYFCTLNLDIEAMKESQERCIREGETQFIITRSRPLQSERYVLADTAVFPFEGRDWTYYLYTRLPQGLF